MEPQKSRSFKDKLLHFAWNLLSSGKPSWKINGWNPKMVLWEDDVQIPIGWFLRCNRCRSFFSQKPGFGDRKIWKLPRPRPRNFPRTWHVKLSMSSRPVGKEFTFLPVKKKKPCKPLEKRVPEITHFLMLYLMIQWSSGKNQINNYRWTIINLVTRPRYVIKKYQKVGAI